MAKHRMRWFKHWNEASQGSTLRKLWDAGDYEAYGLCWIILEMVSKWGDQLTGKLDTTLDIIARETGWKPSKCRRVLLRISCVSFLEMEEKQNGNVTFLVPNWLKFQETRGQKTLQKLCKNGGEVRSKKKEVRIINAQPALRPVFDFNLVYESYPRKLGKKRGLALCLRSVQTEKQYQDLVAAVSHYAEYCRRNKLEPRYIKHFSTFMNAWEDWIDVPVEAQIDQRSKTPVKVF